LHTIEITAVKIVDKSAELNISNGIIKILAKMSNLHSAVYKISHVSVFWEGGGDEIFPKYCRKFEKLRENFGKIS